MADTATPTLTGLPLELLFQVIEDDRGGHHHCPASLVAYNLSLTCRHLRDKLSSWLCRRREYCLRYRDASDVSPLTIPTLLRDPMAREYVRTLEVYASRHHWDEWKTVPYHYDKKRRHNNDEDAALPDANEGDEDRAEHWSYTQDELTAFRGIMRRRLRLDEVSVRFWMPYVENGDDGVLKVLVMALCPNLERVTFVNYGHHDTWPLDAAMAGIDDEPRENPCFSFLGSVLRALYDDSLTLEHGRTMWESRTGPRNRSSSLSSPASWPPGFLSIRTVQVGVPGQEVREDWDPVEGVGGWNSATPHVKDVAPLFLLPGIESLYLSEIAMDLAEEDDEDNLSGSEPNEQDNVMRLDWNSCPSLRRLCFDSIELPEWLYISTIFDACPNLDHLVFQKCDLESVGLDWLMLPGRNTEEGYVRQDLTIYDCMVQGYRSGAYSLDEGRDTSNVNIVHTWDLLLAFCDLKRMASLLEYQDMDREHIEKSLADGTMRAPDLLARLCRSVLEGRDVVVFMGGTTLKKDNFFFSEKAVFPKTPSDEECWDIFDEALALMIEEAYNDRQPPNDNVKIPVLCLMGVEGGSNDRIMFQNTIKAGQKTGHGVHTRTTKLPEDYGSLLPVLPTEMDLKNRPACFTAQDKNTRYLDPWIGMVRGCRNCGSCKKCLSIYPKELWDARTWV